MPTNHTQNYNLSQWERSDKVLMEDFNEDNAKIDAALKAEADARTSAVASLASQLAGKGNCRIYTTSYVGNGQYGADTPNTISFPSRPAIVFIAGTRGYIMPIAYSVETVYAYGGSGYISSAKWSGNTLQVTSSKSSSLQMNDSGQTYYVIALIVN